MVALFRASQYNYNPLSTAVDDGDDSTSSKSSLEDLKHSLSLQAQPKASRIPFYSVLFCIICALASLSLQYYYNTHPSTENLNLWELYSRTDLKNLRRPTQFQGLDKIKRPIPPVPREIFNFPIIVGRVDEKNPGNVITSGLESHKYIRGLEARKVETRGGIGTITQFRMMDWGMETCTLHIRLPRENDVRAANVTLGYDTNKIDVYRVDSDSTIDIHALSSRTRPPKNEKLGTLAADHGTFWTYQFHCAMDSLQTFYLAPGTDETSVEWWQDKQTDAPAVYIIQHSTK